jgi:hypothetical protein
MPLLPEERVLFSLNRCDDIPTELRRRDSLPPLQGGPPEGLLPPTQFSPRVISNQRPQFAPPLNSELVFRATNGRSFTNSGGTPQPDTGLPRPAKNVDRADFGLPSGAGVIRGPVPMGTGVGVGTGVGLGDGVGDGVGVGLSVPLCCTPTPWLAVLSTFEELLSMPIS